ncbi:hypothetical protein AAFF_G00422350 [Aldrovandia affinis]|uniref:P-selectin glycoprotein ligand 1 n=1 Tax=Aldrovandia affinis TaxID=143900 RepID=A0AAD7T6H7_9TELE|nr:hypothetical protein AAFF_G00422350 [Aldrovandia affinis]
MREGWKLEEEVRAGTASPHAFHHLPNTLGLVFGSEWNFNLTNRNSRVLCPTPPLGKDGVFVMMAKTWPLLLLLLALVNPLLSVHLPSDKEADNGTAEAFNQTAERVNLTTPTPTPLVQDREDNALTTVAARASGKPTEATSETHGLTTEEDFEDVTVATELSSSHVTENQQPTDRQSTAHSTTVEVEATQPTATVASRGPTLSWYKTFVNATMMTLPPGTTEAPKLPVESTVNSEARPETAHPVSTTTRPAEAPTVLTQSPLSTSGAPNTTNSTREALVPDNIPIDNLPGMTLAETKPTPVAPGSQDKGSFPCTIPKSRRDGLVGQCLIAIASLAAVATIFIVSTIILCTKLSSSKYRYKMNQTYGTEMVCISSLLPDGNGTHARPRNPKCNGALIPNIEDSEGDDLTLHSFLPEMDRTS